MLRVNLFLEPAPLHAASDDRFDKSASASAVIDLLRGLRPIRQFRPNPLGESVGFAKYAGDRAYCEAAARVRAEIEAMPAPSAVVPRLGQLVAEKQLSGSLSCR